MPGGRIQVPIEKLDRIFGSDNAYLHKQKKISKIFYFVLAMYVSYNTIWAIELSK